MIRARVVRLRQRTPSPGGSAEIPDTELVRQAHAGDVHAEEALFRRHAGYVASLAFRLLGDRCESEDIVQETFLAAIGQMRAQFEPVSLRQWLVGIAVHKVHRRFRRRKLQALLGLFRPATDSVLETCASAETHPEVRAELALLDVALAPLSDVDRAAWMLRYVEGYGLEDVARLCRCSLSTAKRRIARAQQLVRAHIELEEVDDE
ncbi:MAG TPA: RNA polymerase sigma factor [Polyangiaceae bacterium]|jgi:RNA polymerase sigma-70 factor (ECF subfamily)|nr:RNA polymerase sigma factor [Polyangiaceae bacterium]